MLRVKSVVSVLLTVVGACVLAPAAAAADGDQVVRVQDGKVRCLLTAHFRDRDYGAVVCERTDGERFGVTPMSTGIEPEPLNLAMMTETGAWWFIAGKVPGEPANDVTLGPGQTYRANGWTVMPEERRTMIRNDRYGGVLNVSPGDIRKN
ncbi:hypothetical protein ACQI4F_09990 [Mycolicibacterium vaccae]|uniref:hypothetical protein n=1 Tax=Mycolicibacterium vaccae TaxID=1810 RepID=UPI003CEB4B07